MPNENRVRKFVIVSIIPGMVGQIIGLLKELFFHKQRNIETPSIFSINIINKTVTEQEWYSQQSFAGGFRSFLGLCFRSFLGLCFRSFLRSKHIKQLFPVRIFKVCLLKLLAKFVRHFHQSSIVNFWHLRLRQYRWIRLYIGITV